MDIIPEGMASTIPSAACSPRSWRQRPHGALGDEPALGAQRDAVAGVLHVAARDETAVIDQGGGTDLEAGVGGVGVSHGLDGEVVQVLPVDVGQGGGGDRWVHGWIHCPALRGAGGTGHG